MVPNAALWPFFGIGVISCSFVLYRFYSFILLHFRSSSLPRYHHGPNPPWALVTGASDGIGFAFAQELGRRGFNVVLHGRNPTKLSACQTQLEKEYPDRKFLIFVADVTRESEQAVRKFVESAAGDLDLTVLVNNVGGTKGFLEKDFTPLADHSPTEIAKLMEANMRFSTLLTAALLPVLAQHQPGLIINTGSTSAIGMPYLSVYAATKAYIAAWSYGLKAEMQAEGLDIEVHDVESGTTQSGQNKTKESLTTPTAKTFARAAIDKVGCGRVVVPGWWVHHLLKVTVEVLPEWAQRWVLVKALKPMKDKGLSEFSRTEMR